MASGKIWPLCEICISGASPVGRRRFLAPLIPKIDVPLIFPEVQGFSNSKPMLLGWDRASELFFSEGNFTFLTWLLTLFVSKMIKAAQGSVMGELLRLFPKEGHLTSHWNSRRGGQIFPAKLLSWAKICNYTVGKNMRKLSNQQVQWAKLQKCFGA